MKGYLYFRTALLLLFTGWCAFSSGRDSSRPEMNLLPYDGSTKLNEFLVREAHEQYEKRRQVVAEVLKTPEGVRNYISKVRKDYLSLLDLNWRKTPLNPVVTGKIDCDGYRIEKVAYESRPGHHVTGNLYIPSSGKGPFPAILGLCGHSANGKARDVYQSFAILFAKNGFVLFLIDTYSQGERLLQYRDQEGAKSVSHTGIDIGAMLTGSDLAAWQLWDNVRGLDYLCSRPEVDREKLGVTGNSGGGTMTMFMAAYDPRIKVAAISCGLQTRERMFTLNGPADGCHHLPGEGEKMLEYADYLLMAAPKPVIVLAGEKDNMFDINAVSKTVREAKWFYKALGYPGQIDLYTVDEGHGYHKGLREMAVWWSKKWLMNNTDPVIEPELTLQNDLTLQVTTTGQVLTGFEKEKSIVDLNLESAAGFLKQRQDFLLKKTNEERVSVIKKLLGIKENPARKMVSFVETGEIQKDGYHIRKIIISSRDGFPLPALLCIPEGASARIQATVFIHPGGKSRLFDKASGLDQLLQKGRMVLAVDLRGLGETEDEPVPFRKGMTSENTEHRIAQSAIHIGRPLVGQRVQDVSEAIDYLLSVSGIDLSDIELTGYGHCGIVALHAAVLDPRISKTRVTGSVTSWLDIIRDPRAKDYLRDVVPGVLKYYDLPDLVKAAKPGSVEITDPVGSSGTLFP